MNKKKPFFLRLRAPFLTATALTSFASACTSGSTEPADPGTVEQQVVDTLPALIESSIGAFDLLGQSEPLQSLTEGMNTMSVLFAPVTDSSPSMGNPLANMMGTNLLRFADNDPSLEGDNEIDGQMITEILIDEIFNDDNYLSDGDYAIPASLVCQRDEGSLLPSGGSDSSLDPECVDMLARIIPIVHVERAGDGLDFDLLIGPSRNNPLGLEMRSDRVSLVADLAEVQGAIQFLAELEGEEIDLPDTIVGIVAATLKAHGPEDLSLSLSIRSAIEVSGLVDGEAMSIGIAAADPMFSLRASAPKQEIVASIDVNEVLLSLPIEMDGENDSRRLDVDWKGISATFTANGETGDGGITNMGLGDGKSTIMLDRKPLLTFELNANSGYSFDLAISEPASEFPVFEIDPELNLEVFVDLRVAAEENEEIPEALAGETYRIEVGGMSPSIQAVGISEDEGAIRVVSGDMRISSREMSQELAVATGQCLVGSEFVEGEHEILGHFEAGDCP